MEHHSRFGPFLTVTTPELTQLLAALQSDLVAALAGTAPRRPWGRTQSACGLEAAVTALVLSTIVGTNMRVEPRLDLHAVMAHRPWVTVYEHITLAAVSAYCARGLLTVIAAVLDSLDGGSAKHTWAQADVPSNLDADSFAAWIGANGRRLLQSMLPGLEAGTGAAFKTVIARARCLSG